MIKDGVSSSMSGPESLEDSSTLSSLDVLSDSELTDLVQGPHNHYHCCSLAAFNSITPPSNPQVSCILRFDQQLYKINVFTCTRGPCWSYARVG